MNSMTKRKTPSHTDQGLDEVSKETCCCVLLYYIISSLKSIVKWGGEIYEKRL